MFPSENKRSRAIHGEPPPTSTDGPSIKTPSFLISLTVSRGFNIKAIKTTTRDLNG